MKRTIVYICISIALSSCSVDDFHPDIIDSTRDWEYVLSKIQSDNKSLFESNDLSIEACYPLSEDIEVSESVGKGYFPVYHGDKLSFDIMPYELLVNDTTTAHINFSKNDSIVNELTNSNKEYQLVNIDWKKG